MEKEQSKHTPLNSFLLPLIAVLVGVVGGFGAVAFWVPSSGYGAVEPVNVTVDLTAGPINTFTPAAALGGTVDGHSRGDSAAIYRPATLRAMRSAGLHSISYRLRTELGIEAWHWNPQGRWSDAKHHRGYWTSDDRPGAPIPTSYGYRLPRRGNTIDQAEDNGYSRLADGDLNTFWKSNPYLDRRYTGENNSRHPQWVIADLGKRIPVNAIRIVWGIPYAVRYRVQYWKGKDPEDPGAHPEGRWQAFSRGGSVEGRGGDVTLRLAPDPDPGAFSAGVDGRFVRNRPAGSERPPRRAWLCGAGSVYRDSGCQRPVAGCGAPRSQSQRPDPVLRFVNRPLAPGLRPGPGSRAAGVRSGVRQRDHSGIAYVGSYRGAV